MSQANEPLLVAEFEFRRRLLGLMKVAAVRLESMSVHNSPAAGFFRQIPPDHRPSYTSFVDFLTARHQDLMREVRASKKFIPATIVQIETFHLLLIGLVAEGSSAHLSMFEKIRFSTQTYANYFNTVLAAVASPTGPVQDALELAERLFKAYSMLCKIAFPLDGRYYEIVGEAF